MEVGAVKVITSGTIIDGEPPHVIAKLVGDKRQQVLVTKHGNVYVDGRYYARVKASADVPAKTRRAYRTRNIGKILSVPKPTVADILDYVTDTLCDLHGYTVQECMGLPVTSVYKC